MDFQRLREIVEGFAGRKLIVLGDLMMDEYVWGRTSRISPEAPVMVIDTERETSVPGGAANVVNNLLALGAEVSVVGVVGEDSAGEALIRALRECGADTSGIVPDASRPTTRKTRVVAHHQQVLRVDREQTHPISDAIAAQLQSALRHAADQAQAVVVSEYNKGVFTPTVAQAVTGLCRGSHLLLTSNPKPPNARRLAGANLISLNQSEARSLSGDDRFAFGEEVVSPDAPFAGQEGLEAAGAALVQSLGVQNLVVTHGAKGLSVFHADGTATHIPPHLVEVYDAAGAGDTVISTTSLALAAGATVAEAATLGSFAAACVVRKVGVATVTPDELIAELPQG
jgi:D-beta-D-heptose 7-phosphate kinase/D-beta-D-heptose 1-phosphate adenosyltransferase